MDFVYFEDVRLHEKCRSRGYLLTQKEMIEFAGVWEPRPYHIDPEFARNTRFGGLIATGNHLISIAYRLNYELTCEKSPATAYVVSPGLDRVRFVIPARPGDVLAVEAEAVSKRESKSNADAGIVVYAYTLLNQNDEPVLTYEAAAFVEKRPG